jgi:hypothetical protein
MSSYKTRAQDQRLVEDVAAGKELACAASGCPHRWSVDAGAGRLCSWHAWSDPHLWPQVTQEQLEAMTEKARQHRELVPPRALSRADKTQILNGLREVLKPRQGRKGWAQRIVDRVCAGERVTPLVLKMARAVCRNGGEA